MLRFLAPDDNHKFGVLVPNYLGSTLKDATADRAQHIHELLHVPVVAYERPGTGDQVKQLPFTPESYLRDVEKRAAIFNKEAEKLGIKEWLICGNSAAGLEAIVLASTGHIKVKRVIAIEPIGMRRSSFAWGFAKWMKANMDPKRAVVSSDVFSGVETLGDIRPPAGFRKSFRRAGKELRTYDHVFRSDFALQRLDVLAKDYPQISVDVVLADQSFTTTPALLQNLRQRFAGTSVNIEVLQGTKHGFPDKHHHFVHVVRRSLA